MLFLHTLLLLFLAQTCSAQYLRQLSVARDDKADPACVDTTATFNLDKKEDGGDANLKDCDWLSHNLDELNNTHHHGHFCAFHRISSLCRVTCGVCKETKMAVDLLKTCSDHPEPIAIPNLDAKIDCAWLHQHKSEYGDACDLTEVALHCPTTCGTFGLCGQEQDEST